MSCPTCEICGEENGFLRCRDVGPLCFDCWGSGIHEVMKRKISIDAIVRWLETGRWFGRVLKGEEDAS
jgi:hypothetical protein